MSVFDGSTSSGKHQSTASIRKETLMNNDGLEHDVLHFLSGTQP
jgi:hypothetical protein